MQQVVHALILIHSSVALNPLLVLFFSHLICFEGCLKMDILNRSNKKGNVPFQARFFFFFFFLYKNNFQKIMPPNKNLTASQTVRSWSQAGQVQPSFVLNWKHLENVKFHKIHSVKSQLSF